MGGGGPYAVGDSVLYSTDGEGTEFALARVVAVDQSVVPPAYVVDIDGAEAKHGSDQAGAAAEPADGAAVARRRRKRDDGGNVAGVAAAGVHDAAHAFVRHDVDSTRVGSTRDAFATVDEGDELVANDDDDEKRKARSTTSGGRASGRRASTRRSEPRCRSRRRENKRASRRRAAFVEAHELAMRAAQFLDPERGDKRNAAECLRRALEALEAV